MVDKPLKNLEADGIYPHQSVITKRKRRASLETTLSDGDALARGFSDEEDIASQRQKKPKTESRAPNEYSADEIEAFMIAKENIQDWASSDIETKYLDVITWTDRDHLTCSECAVKFVDEGHALRNSCSAQHINRIYGIWAPRFYAEMGITFVPIAVRPRHWKSGKDTNSRLVSRQQPTPMKKTQADRKVGRLISDSGSHPPILPRSSRLGQYQHQIRKTGIKHEGTRTVVRSSISGVASRVLSDEQRKQQRLADKKLEKLLSKQKVLEHASMSVDETARA